MVKGGRYRRTTPPAARYFAPPLARPRTRASRTLGAGGGPDSRRLDCPAMHTSFTSTIQDRPSPPHRQTSTEPSLPLASPGPLARSRLPPGPLARSPGPLARSPGSHSVTPSPSTDRPRASQKLIPRAESRARHHQRERARPRNLSKWMRVSALFMHQIGRSWESQRRPCEAGNSADALNTDWNPETLHTESLQNACILDTARNTLLVEACRREKRTC